MPQPPCPECEKLHDIAPYSQKVGEFIEWLRSEKGAVIATHHEHSDECYDGEYTNCGLRKDELCIMHFSTEKLLAEFFGIDLDKVERERRALLEYLSQKGGK
jgi:hypothetical protein